jgi:hypothetical protein
MFVIWACSCSPVVYLRTWLPLSRPESPYPTLASSTPDARFSSLDHLFCVTYRKGAAWPAASPFLALHKSVLASIKSSPAAQWRPEGTLLGA